MKKLPIISKEIYEHLTETKGYLITFAIPPCKLGGTNYLTSNKLKVTKVRESLTSKKLN